MSRLIDADALKGALKELPLMSNWGESFIPLLIDEQPTIDPVKHAHWKYNEECEEYFCSSCGHMVGRMIDVPIEIEEEFITGQKGKKVMGWALRTPYYCQYCGAKMDEEVPGND